MRVFEIKYLGPTDNRGGRMKVTELIDGGKKILGKTYGYPHHVDPGEVEWWSLARHLGLEAYDDPAIRSKSVKVQTGGSEYIIVIGLV